MGILDEAIREHLELKRRLGADTAEVERLEKEAFGAGEQAAAEPGPAAEPEPATPDPEPVPPAAHEPEPAAPEPPPVDQPTRQFTVEELEAAAAADAPAEADDSEHDELEETPDFLQETPEHDRLWFEQKPPKDFDF